MYRKMQQFPAKIAYNEFEIPQFTHFYKIIYKKTGIYCKTVFTNSCTNVQGVYWANS